MYRTMGWCDQIVGHDVTACTWRMAEALMTYPPVQNLVGLFPDFEPSGQYHMRSKGSGPLQISFHCAC